MFQDLYGFRISSWSRAILGLESVTELELDQDHFHERYGIGIRSRPVIGSGSKTCMDYMGAVSGLPVQVWD